MTKDTKNEAADRGAMWDTAAVAAFLGVQPKTVREYVARKTLPQPDGRLGRSLFWYERTIRNFDRPGPGRPKKQATETKGV
ncbi:MarR family transcriptional regulator [Streptomyces europaeiscabiei]|uniref:MarR family transcriptional regulator n=1 Tax=Streptomyces europaeiscabiei TaxID=146819 RepID=UPI0029AD923F|nr:MarR family transcriptional regulator [Streptomyces europaeiscabiei]MDX3860057.1 MarR family transcriptional regulator [Streptomyces europaeiscabiei]